MKGTKAKGPMAPGDPALTGQPSSGVVYVMSAKSPGSGIARWTPRAVKVFGPTRTSRPPGAAENSSSGYGMYQLFPVDPSRICTKASWGPSSSAARKTPGMTASRASLSALTNLTYQPSKWPLLRFPP